MNILITYLHFIGIMVLMGSLITEHVILKPGITKDQIKTLAMVDLIYGISAAIVLITGLLRWFVVDPKGAAYFNTNPLFHIKLTFFVIAVILSIFPTMKFLKWRKSVINGKDPEITTQEVKKQLMFLRIELLILAIIPLLAVMVASGIRM
jgi:putative membrane protein